MVDLMGETEETEPATTKQIVGFLLGLSLFICFVCVVIIYAIKDGFLGALTATAVFTGVACMAGCATYGYWGKAKE
jgi:hypothetical protein